MTGTDRPSGTGATPSRRGTACAAAAVVIALTVTGCAAAPALSDADDRVQVVTTTPLLADLVGHVGGERVRVASLVRDGADPHEYAPTLRDARNVVYADAAFSNYALLEEHGIIKTLDANLRPGAPNVSLAEESVKYAAELIPLVEDAGLDTVWLGARVHGDGRQWGATRASQVVLEATGMTGPGKAFAYLTGTFGDTDVMIDSADGFGGARPDTIELPVDAHSHLSWAFTEPGVYTLDLRASLRLTPSSPGIDLAAATYTFAVGVDPSRASIDGAVVLDEGHADVTADLDTRRMRIRYDPDGGGEHTQQDLDPARIVIEVPAKAQEEIPGGSDFAFLGRPGERVYQLAQAVLGRHIHGEIDPHLWQNVRNVMAYVQLIRDTLVEVDPAGAAEYARNTDRYLAELDDTDRVVRETIAAIPPERRWLVTTHDAFGYLAQAYDLRIAGFVTPNPATEPSLADRRRLADTIRSLHVPAVFVEPNLAARSTTLADVARAEGVAICPIYGDTFDAHVRTYLDLIRANARSLADCLGTAPREDPQP
ncbi:MAG: anchored repeat ABC transporter, substrate-binding protein [Microbacterium sp.]|uniref:anchored repeat ABC transporter, substrate-binding protein n=1 Tax=Microbacterium sp. TaxID=51671 RepID=UPI001AD148A5|nr:anchored repeat ABC transporter, substrate-binding protein [Microbacterium sp.]MBN9177984.1 anchored repeat ABC transporter, substrate-binding protein [Microbacterium sp.]